MKHFKKTFLFCSLCTLGITSYIKASEQPLGLLFKELQIHEQNKKKFTFREKKLGVTNNSGKIILSLSIFDQNKSIKYFFKCDTSSNQEKSFKCLTFGHHATIRLIKKMNEQEKQFFSNSMRGYILYSLKEPSPPKRKQ